MKTITKIVTSLSLVSAVCFTAAAAPISVHADNFGTITTFSGGLVEFGGDGIPSDATNFSDFTDEAGNRLRLGLSATQRFSAPTPDNDGAGTFFVIPGVDGGGQTFWNFSFYAELESNSLSIEDINLELLFDLDPLAGTDVNDLGIISLSNAPTVQQFVSEGSQNATFNYLSTTIPGLVTPPTVSAFDPNFGEYSFQLRSERFGRVGMNVNVNPVSAPAAGILMSFAIGGLVIRKKIVSK